MFASEDFYNKYELNFFDYKQHSNDYLLKLGDDEINELTKEIYFSSPKDFRRNVKVDIRMTCLWSIDTLFEIIYAILPDHKQRIQDDLILRNLTQKGKLYYKDLAKYLKGSKGVFERLNWFIKYQENNSQKLYSCSVLRHIFYKGLFEMEEEKEIKESVGVINDLLKILGHEITENREQLNSLKHGFRTFQFLKEFRIEEPDNSNSALKFDLEDSFSYQTIDRKTGKRTVQTSVLSPERDLAFTQICSNLLYNILITRKTDKERFKVKEGYYSFLFTKQTIDEIKKLNPRISNLKIHFE